MKEFLSATHDVGVLLALLQDSTMRELLCEYASLNPTADAGLLFCMADVYVQAARKFVIIFDELGCVMREMQTSHET